MRAKITLEVPVPQGSFTFEIALEGDHLARQLDRVLAVGSLGADLFELLGGDSVP